MSMEITEKQVLQALSHVQEPDLGKDLVTLGMIQNIKITGNEVGFDVILTTPACPLKEVIERACINAIHHFVDKNAIVKPRMTSRVSTTRLNADVLSGVKNIIAVASGKGGVGKSTLAANLALALHEKGAAVGLLDADIYGPSIPVMFGEAGAPAMKEENGKNIIIPHEVQGIKMLSIGYMIRPEQAVVWRGPMISSALRQFMNESAWGDLDYLIIDLPPGTGDIHLTLAQSFPLTGVVIVTTPQKMATSDAMRAASMFKIQGITIPVLGVVENMAWFTPDDAPDKRYHIFGQGGGRELSEKLQIPFLGEIPFKPDIREGADNARFTKPPAEMINFAEVVAQQVAILNAIKSAPAS